MFSEWLSNSFLILVKHLRNWSVCRHVSFFGSAHSQPQIQRGHTMNASYVGEAKPQKMTEVI